MLILILGLALFIFLHSLRELRLRDIAIERWGMKPYMGLFSVGVFIAIGLIILGRMIAPFDVIYVPRYEQRVVTSFFMLPAFVLFVAGNTPKSYIRLTVRNPMMLGTAIWGGSHLIANGDLASVLMFGSLGLWGLFKFVSLGLTQPTLCLDMGRCATCFDSCLLVHGRRARQWRG